MKKIVLFVLLFGLVVSAKSAQVCIDTTQQEIDVVEYFVTDAEAWVETFWINKVQNRTKDFIREEVDVSIEEESEIPKTKDAIVRKKLDRPDYKSKKERDEAKALEDEQ